VFTVIAFDISDDRTRYRVVKALKKYAIRVQKSVFEAAHLPENHLRRLQRQVERLIDPKTDRVRYYFLCAACKPRIESVGRGEIAEYEEFRVI
jgi:CRISPR-associated protein Cas2